MEPLEWGLVSVGALMLKKAAETASETLTKEAMNGVLPRLKLEAAKFSSQLRWRCVKPPHFNRGI